MQITPRFGLLPILLLCLLFGATLAAEAAPGAEASPGAEAAPGTEATTKAEAAPPVIQEAADAQVDEAIAPDEADEEVTEAARKAIRSGNEEPWLRRGSHLPRLAANLIPEVPLPRPIDASYQLRSGDLVRIVTWGGVNLNDAVPVAPAGNLAVPGIGAVPVAGLTQAQAESRVVGLLRRHFLEAGAIVAVESPRAQVVLVTGEVRRPGALSLPPGGTVLEALAAAGGVHPRGSLRGIVLRAPSAAHAATLDLYPLALDGLSEDIVSPLEPGSHIHVPLAGSLVQVFGAVRRPAQIELREDEDLAQALALAGGLAIDAAPERLLLVRSGSAGQELHTLTLESLAGRAARDDDRLLIRRKPTAASNLALVQAEGAVLNPGSQAFRAGMSVGELIAACGGLLPGADRRQAVVYRRLVPPRPVQLPDGSTAQQFEDLLHPVEDATPLQPLDRLVIPKALALGDSLAHVRINGAVARPGAYPYHAGLKVGDLINVAGGLVPGADLQHARITRLLSEPVQVELGSGAVDRIFHQTLTKIGLDTVLSPQDRLDLPLAPAADEQLARVAIAGAVRHPGSHGLSPGMTVADLLNLAGGVTARAQTEQADLVRWTRLDAQGRQDVERLSLDLRPILSAAAKGPELRHGDTLIVRASTDARLNVTLTGELRNPGSLMLPAGTTLAQALQLAGGPTEQAFPIGVRLYRQSEAAIAQEMLHDLAARVEAQVEVGRRQLADIPANDEQHRAEMTVAVAQAERELARIQLARATGRLAGIDLDGILAGRDEADLVLEDGDRIEIPPRPGTFRVLGEVMTPGALRYEPGLRVPQLLARVGGTTRQADAGMIYVVRADGSVVATGHQGGTAWDPMLRRWTRTRLSRLELAEGDTVIVPPDLRYRPASRVLAKDWSQVLFQVAGAVGTIALLAK